MRIRPEARVDFSRIASMPYYDPSRTSAVELGFYREIHRLRTREPHSLREALTELYLGKITP